MTPSTPAHPQRVSAIDRILARYEQAPRVTKAQFQAVLDEGRTHRPLFCSINPMNPARVIYEDAPAFIPVPAHLQHQRVEAIFWPLDEPSAVLLASPIHVSQTVASAQAVADSPRVIPLSQLIGKAKCCYDNATAVDQFIRAGRDEWER